MGLRLGGFGKPDVGFWDEYNGFPYCPPTCSRVKLNGMGVRTLHISWVSSVTHALLCSSLLVAWGLSVLLAKVSSYYHCLKHNSSRGRADLG